MAADIEASIEEEVAAAPMGRPHVVVLGAGASRATCPDGDKRGTQLPLMADFTRVLGLEPLLGHWGIDPDQNFEEIFSDLYERNEAEKVDEIQRAVESYFGRMELPDKPTIYDHLVLSLRGKDIIATFNWDPLLVHACIRNAGAGLTCPRLAFLHGNIRVGYCAKDRVEMIGAFPGGRCRHCGEQYEMVPLLYPIRRKNYADSPLIANEWKVLRAGFEHAFMITIFGYSGPRTDEEAIAAMRSAWGDKNKRYLEQTSFITTQAEDEVCENWEPFIHTHHYEVHADFYESWIAKHPRRTGEAYFNQYLGARFIRDNPIPRDMDFPALWSWYEQFKVAEDAEGVGPAAGPEDG